MTPEGQEAVTAIRKRLRYLFIRSNAKAAYICSDIRLATEKNMIINNFISGSSTSAPRRYSEPAAGEE